MSLGGGPPWRKIPNSGRRTPPLFVALGTVIAFSSGAAPTARGQDRAEELEGLRGRIQDSRERVTSHEADERALLEQLEDVDRRLSEVARERASARLAVKQAKQRVAELEPALAAAQKSLSKTQRALASRAVALYRGGEKVQMSTRSGEFITLRELRREVGNDAARFFYVMRSNDQHLDFDLQLATSHSNENPVYYIQYAHARVCSVFRQMREKGYAYDAARGHASLHRLVEPHELALLASLSRFPEVIEAAAVQRAPHALVHYLRELANDFHTYYNAHQFLVEDAGLRDARVTLIQGLRQVVRNGLGLLGVSAPEAM